ncbi:MAG: AAA family ATPase [Bacteroidia bacterium]|nr:AAA family ATPase [Bacteroidia bacterium]
MSLHIPGYKLQELIREGLESSVYKAIHLANESTCIIKVLHSRVGLQALRNEFELIQCLSDLFPYSAWIDLEDRICLVRSFVEGTRLQEILKSEEIGIDSFMAYARSISRQLGEIHGHGFIHRDLNPNNIIVTPEGEVFIIDFDLSTRLDLQLFYQGNPENLRGTLPYLSPEQTGRMNRRVDYRTDFYALGATLYHMLCGKPMFESENPMELVHHHLAITPTSPHTIRPEIPLFLSRIVLKLLEKDPESRYQSVSGILHDLALFEKDLTQASTLDDHPLASKDVSSRFIIPDRLYGREEELELLKVSFEQVCSQRQRLLMVSGPSGVGKSALIGELYKPLAQSRGFFLKGKFELLQKNVPHFAWVQAFNQLADLLLSESEEVLESWRKRILKQMGPVVGVLVNMVPRFAQILGEQEEIPQNNSQEARSQFAYAMRQFMKAMASPKHPMVIFLDDCQWGDSASMELIKNLLADTDDHCLLLITAYRSNEVGVDHVYTQMLQELDKELASNFLGREDLLEPIKIELKDLIEADIQSMCMDILSRSRREVEELAGLIYKKTRGNAFYTKRFLGALYENKQLRFSTTQAIWEWQLDAIRLSDATENVIELMGEQLMQLPEETLAVLQLASCDGTDFELGALALIQNEHLSKLEQALRPALLDGFIRPKQSLLVQQGDRNKPDSVNRNFSFVHDRILQAVYESIPEEKKARHHLSLGKYMLEHLSEELKRERLFDLVNQVNYSLQLDETEISKDHLLSLNFQAGKKALKATAFSQAYEYFSICQHLIPDGHWDSHYNLSLSLYQSLAECAAIMVLGDKLDEYHEQIVEHARDLLDTVDTTLLRVRYLYAAKNDFAQAGEEGLILLKKLGIEINAASGQEEIIAEMVQTQQVFANVEIENVFDLPEMTDKEKIASIRLLQAIISVVLFSNPNLFPIVILKSIRILLKYGMVASGQYALSSYAIIVLGTMGDLPSAKRLETLVHRLVRERYPLESRENSRALFSLGFGVKHWFSHLNESILLCRKCSQVSKEMGDVEYAGFNLNLSVQYPLLSGHPLSQVQAQILSALDSHRQMSQYMTASFLEVFMQAIENLMGESEEVLVLKGTSFDEEEKLKFYQEVGNYSGIANVFFLKTMIACLMNRPELSLALAPHMLPCLPAVMGAPYVPFYKYYLGVSYFMAAHVANGKEKKSILTDAEAVIAEFKSWAEFGPDNYASKYEHLLAEKLWIEGEYGEAREAMESALEKARAQKFTHEEALIWERLGRMMKSREKNIPAEHYLKQALEAYQKWEASAKIIALKEEFPELGQRNMGSSELESIKTTKSKSASSDYMQNLDIQSVFKASTALASQINFDYLQESLMRIVLENAGAERGYLIMKEGDGFQLISQAQIGETGFKHFKISLPMDSERNLAISVLNFVLKSREFVVLNDAQSDSRFIADGYLKSGAVKSLLCLPIVHKSEVKGALYLENNLTTDAFQKERVEVLQLLSGQIAVSLENAALYEDLESKVMERTREVWTQSQQLATQRDELAEKNDTLENTLEQLKFAQSQLVQSEKMASLGQLSAGIAHEINNPVNFILSGINSLKLNLSEVQEIWTEMEKLEDNFNAEQMKKVTDLKNELDYNYLMEEIEYLAESIQNGAKRTSEIVKGLRTFSRMDEDALKLADIHANLDSTLLMLHSQYKDKVSINKDYQQIPLIECYPGKINQVFMNILSNAIQAIPEKGNIQISTRKVEEEVEILISDDGTGIPLEVQTKIFDPFFTTKDVGEGTGLGLSISMGIINDHKGKIVIDSTPGKGSTFSIVLPIRQARNIER